MKKNTRKTLDEFIIERQDDFQYSTGELSRLLNSILLAARVVSYKIRKAGLIDIIGSVGMLWDMTSLVLLGQIEGLSPLFVVINEFIYVYLLI